MTLCKSCSDVVAEAKACNIECLLEMWPITTRTIHCRDKTKAWSLLVSGDLQNHNRYLSAQPLAGQMSVSSKELIRMSDIYIIVLKWFNKISE